MNMKHVELSCHCSIIRKVGYMCAHVTIQQASIWVLFSSAKRRICNDFHSADGFRSCVDLSFVNKTARLRRSDNEGYLRAPVLLQLGRAVFSGPDSQEGK